MPKQPSSTPGKKPPAPSLKLRLARSPLEQRSGSKPLEPSEGRQSTARKATEEAETDRGSKPALAHRGPG
jgi:hypothetical protein